MIQSLGITDQALEKLDRMIDGDVGASGLWYHIPTGTLHEVKSQITESERRFISKIGINLVHRLNYWLANRNTVHNLTTGDDVMLTVDSGGTQPGGTSATELKKATGVD